MKSPSKQDIMDDLYKIKVRLLNLETFHVEQWSGLADYLAFWVRPIKDAVTEMDSERALKVAQTIVESIERSITEIHQKNVKVLESVGDPSNDIHRQGQRNKDSNGRDPSLLTGRSTTESDGWAWSRD